MWYAWSIDYHTPNGSYGYTAKGILKANSEEEALDILWEKKGSDNACYPCVGLLDLASEFVELN